MKTIKTETRKQEAGFLIVSNATRMQFLNYGQERYILLILLLLLFQQLSAKVNDSESRWQYTISSGVHSFYAPVENLKWKNPGFITVVGINRLFGEKQSFSLGLNLQYGQNRHQGNATSLQVVGQFLPVVLKKIELGVGTGVGYRLSGYPSDPLIWNGNNWDNGEIYKGIIQVPFQVSAGYRSLHLFSLSVSPFLSYQMQAMFGYNPDFDPLPDSSVLLGLKFKFN
jgi:hypothetical protein